MSNKNEIRGGTRSTCAYAICDNWCGDLYEMSSEVAAQFGYSPYHSWVMVHVIYLDTEFKRKHEQNEELHRELYKTVSLLPSKEWEKVHKILLKHGYDISKV